MQASDEPVSLEPIGQRQPSDTNAHGNTATQASPRRTALGYEVALRVPRREARNEHSSEKAAIFAMHAGGIPR